MNNQTPAGEKTKEVNFYSSKYSPPSDYRDRRRLDMKKRLGILHYRRDRLERELNAIKTALLTLDHQMQSDAAYEQLTMCD